MKNRFLTLILLCSFSFSSSSFELSDIEVLSGDAKKACEVIICMSSSEKPSECNAPLAFYFGIQAKKPSDTIKKRRDFLNACPLESEKDMNNLVDAVSKQEVRCVASELNKMVETKAVGNSDSREYYKRTTTKLPDYCSVLFNHKYTSIKQPRYVCNGKFYSEGAWARGYTVRYDHYDREIRTPIKKDCWVD